MRWWDRHVARGISIYFTKLCLKIGISANQITLLSIFLGIIGGTLLAFGNPIFWIIAGVILYLTAICDVVDGEIARYSKSASAMGAYWDSLASTVIWTYVFICIAFGAYNALNHYIGIVLGILAITLLHLERISALLVYQILSEKGLISEALMKLKANGVKTTSSLISYGQFLSRLTLLSVMILLVGLLDYLVPPFTPFRFTLFLFIPSLYILACLVSITMKIIYTKRKGISIRHY